MSESPARKKNRTKGPSEPFPQAPPADKCNFWLKKKRKYCSWPVVAGSSDQKCGHHKNEPDALRVPCPLDPQHTVYATNLTSHLRICPKATQMADMTSHPAYRENVHAVVALEDPSSMNGGIKLPDFTSVALAVEELFARPDLQEAFSVVRLASFESKAHEAVKNLPVKVETFEDGKHWPQIHKLIEAMALFGEERFLSPESVAEGRDGGLWIELGCGKAKLSLGVYHAGLKKSRHVLVDEAPRSHMRVDPDAPEGTFTKVRMNIKDLVLSEVPAVSASKPEENLRAIGKHLCGAGTDLAISCMNPEHVGRRVDGIAIALCCFGLCSWDPYVGKKWLSETGYVWNEESFGSLAQMAGWYTAVIAPLDSEGVTEGKDLWDTTRILDPSTATSEVLGNLNDWDRARIGAKARRVIDAGRAAALAERGLRTRYIEYCSRHTTPENTLLLATPKE